MRGPEERKILSLCLACGSLADVLGGTPACICNAHKLSWAAKILSVTPEAVSFLVLSRSARELVRLVQMRGSQRRGTFCVPLSVAVSAKRKFLNGGRWHVCAPANRTLMACLRSFVMKGYVE